MNKIRIYGKEVRRWTEEISKYVSKLIQVEIEYKEYDIESGKLVGIGTEDFSKERYENIIKPDVYTWDGQKYNKGGKKWWNYRGYTAINKTDRKALKEYMTNKYGEEVQLRA